ncbi:hypothetical protein B296_00050998 [Ensete ventricosum]|uniref:UAS domain-containing protein n=1 Tax=Ensete ventricosum TaxID=4639 RepID=A0A426YIS9_ENSVE|nr:hypothetical protein B296_00050998 [Ensete ventricosum]
MADGSDEKLAYFQDITGLDDPDLCTEILSAHNWDLEIAISSFTSHVAPSSSSSIPPSSAAASSSSSSISPSATAASSSAPPALAAPPPGLGWKIVTLPFYVVSGGVHLITGAVGLGFWIAGGVLSRTLGLLGISAVPRDQEADRLIPLSASAAEAADFVAAFERDYGGAASSAGPRFVAEGFVDALHRSQREYKLMFVYLHSPEHPDVPAFCKGCLCSPAVAAFVNENFVAWGGSIRREEGFKMSNSLKASRFPFCALVMPSTNQRIVLLQQVCQSFCLLYSVLQIEGSMSPEEMLTILQRVVEECAPSLVVARLDAEERRNNQQLREEQDAAYRAALEADQVCRFLGLSCSMLCD